MAGNQANNADGGFRNHRIEYVRESTQGETPSDPEWNLYSDNLDTTLVASVDAQIEEQRGVGDVNVQDFFAGPEDHSASIDYHLQDFFVDGSGDALDAAGDAILRDAENDVSTHTAVDRYTSSDGTRVYTVLKGGFPNIGEITGDPSSGLPIMVSLEYEAKKVRRYKVGQPDAGTTLEVVSSSADDTTQTLTIEDEGAGTTEDVSLNGTTTVTTTETFSDIDALELDAETTGDVTVSDGSGTDFATIRGANYYDGVEGDLGVPALGAGSHPSEKGTSYERFLDDDITRGGTSIGVEIRSASASVSNNYDKTAIAGTKCQAIHEGAQDAELSATVAGEFQEYSDMEDHLSATKADIVWTFSGGTLTFADAALTDLGDIGPSAGDVISTQENTFTAGDVNVSSN